MSTPLSGPLEGFEAPGYMTVIMEGQVEDFDVPDFGALFGWKPTDEVTWDTLNGEAENHTTREERTIPAEVRNSAPYKKLAAGYMRQAYTEGWETERRKGNLPATPNELSWFNHKGK